jgi:hypothetical protein
MLRGGRGELWAGTHDLTFDHHKTTTSLRRSREADCSICISLANVLRHDMDLLEDRSISIKAKLWRLPEDKPDEDESNEDKRPKEIKYCLDFDMNRTHSRMYLLKETSKLDHDIRYKICSKDIMQIRRIVGCERRNRWIHLRMKFST